jgi:hypothetical protein
MARPELYDVDFNENGAAGDMRTGEGTRKYSDITYPYATLSTINPTLHRLGSISGLAQLEASY